MESASLMFAETVRCVSAVARRRNLTVPAYRSPPADTNSTRTIRRSGGRAVVAVRIAGRSASEVQADVIEGVLAANNLPTSRRQPHRRAMWAALHAAGLAD